MINRLTGYLDFAVYWLIILIPFSMAIASAPMNVCMGLLIFSYILKKTLRMEWPIPKTAINLPLLLFFLITCVSIVYSINFKDTFRGGILRLLSFSFVFLILSCELKNKSHIMKIILSAAAGLILTSINAIWQRFSGYDFMRGYSLFEEFHLLRSTASFSDPNTLGIYLSALSPLLLGLSLYYFKGRNKAVCLFFSLLVLGGVLLTYSRPTFLALYLALFFFGLIKKDRLLITALVILTLIGPFLVPAPIKDWARQMNYNPLRLMCNDDRIAIYRNSLNMIRAHPLIGVGANVYMKNYKQYKESPEYNNVVTADYLYAHNNFLQMAAELGLPGLAVFIWMLFRLFKECSSIYRRLKDKFLRITQLCLIACLIAFLANGLTESSLYYARLALIFWYLMGFALGLKKFAYADKTG